MSNRKRSSKRKLRIPLKFGDPICELGKSRISKEGVEANNDNGDEIKDCADSNNDGKQTAEAGSSGSGSVEEFKEYEEEYPTLNETILQSGCVNKESGGKTVNSTECCSEFEELTKETNSNKKEDNINRTNDNQMKGIKKTFASVVMPDGNGFDNKLELIPTMSEDGRDVVFDEEMIMEESRKWKMTLCGHFIGFKMSYNELHYNIRKMWGKYGLIDTVAQNGLYYFKFNNEYGMNQVLESGPWMVSNRPLFVQKWDPSVNIDLSEPVKLPLWIKLHNVPIEAWTVKGISAIASSLGTPLIMDKTTTRMCHGVLVEWVFGHCDRNCKKQGNEGVNVEARKENYGNIGAMTEKRGWVQQQRKKGGENLEKSKDYRSANKFAIFEEIEDSEIHEVQERNMKDVVDKYVNYQRQPTMEETKNWCKEMSKCIGGVQSRFVEWIPMTGTNNDLRIAVWNVRGMCNSTTQKEMSKMNESKRGCRIIMGWNPDDVNVMNIHTSNQAMLCLIETVDTKEKFFCCFTYAASFGKERRNLWNDISMYKGIVDNHPWVLMGDWNVSLELDEHSEGGAFKTTDMIEFQECLDCNEIEDINRTGVHFTWVQNRLDHSSGIMKKIDRVLSNVGFIDKHPNSHAIFMPHLTSNHSPAVEGCKMYQLVKKQKAMKLHIKKLSWKNDFNDAVHDEEKFLFQQAKVNWLSDGDRNSRYFHTMIKRRQNRSRIDMVYNESGDCFKGNQVAEQFVIHFQKFFGQKVAVQSLNLNVFKSLKRISTENADHMTRSVTDAEIKNAMFDICDNKAPGPDGYTAKFYKKSMEQGWEGYVDTSRGRGLKQGDPMSPYIFTMIMEVFTLILQKQIEDCKKFKYHWGCKKLGISHLCFVDDLLVLSHGDLESIMVIKKAMDLIKARVNSWKNKLLSYAGRLQLIASVLASMHIYWASAFRLPKAVIKDIDKPKNEGSLGIKNLGDWNDALLSKHLWNVISNKESSWVEWINAMRLKGKCIWTIKHDSNASCGWNQMLDLRDKMRKYVEYKIGDEKSIFLWHDKWWGDSSLCDLIPNEILQRYNMNDVKVRDMVRNGKWQWPAEWKRTYSVLKSIHVLKFKEGCKDRVVWKTSDGSNVKFSANRTWMDWRIKEETVPWRKGGLVFTLYTQTLLHILAFERLHGGVPAADACPLDVWRFGNVVELEISPWLPILYRFFCILCTTPIMAKKGQQHSQKHPCHLAMAAEQEQLTATETGTHECISNRFWNMGMG
ncbi:RNA-directed DNA polymerase, eukaryota, reverse transcriptase zinc-binding domain protein [Tanacetum coccineum]